MRDHWVIEGCDVVNLDVLDLLLDLLLVGVYWVAGHCNTFTLHLVKSWITAASTPNSVVQTEVKSAGCETNIPHL